MRLGMYRVTRSRLTGHWIVNHGSPDALGFRWWEDAVAEALARATRHAERMRRLGIYR